MTRSFASLPSPRLALAALAGLAVPFSAVHAQTLTWNNAAGGSAGVAGNWNPAQVPGAGSILNYNLPGNFAVSFPATVPASSQQNFNAGTVSLSALSPHVMSTQFVVGLALGSNPTVTFTGGSLSATIMVVASPATSTATLNVTGATADLAITGPSGIRIGSSGNGTLAISNGGSLRCTNAILTSLQAGSQGAISVSGVSAGTRSELVTLDPVGGDLTIALNGTGTLNVSAGGLVDIADDAFFAPTASITGVATFGSATADNSLFNVAGDLHIGHNASAAAAGTGTLNANDGSLITVAGTTFVGDSAGGTGTLTIHQGGELRTTSLTVDPAHGVLNHAGGDLRIETGVLLAPNNQLVMNGAAGEQPRLFFDDSTATLAAVSPARALTVGSSRQAILALIGLAQLNVTSGDVVIGDLAGSTGLIQAQIGGRLTIASSGMLTVGNAGFGQLGASVHSHITCGPLQAGVAGTGVGELNIVNTNTALDIVGTLALGGTLNAPGGVANMTIGTSSPQSGTVSVTSGVIGGANTKVWAGASLTINAGGRLVSDQPVTGPGSITLAGGAIQAPNVVPAGARTYSFAGTISDLFQPVGAAVINLTGTLTVGLLRNNAVINVGDRTLHVLSDAGGSADLLGNCTLGALGHVVLDDGGALLAGKTLSGDGVVDGAIENLGVITATGSGLRLNGVVTGLGQGIAGTAIEFGPGGGFTGTGGFGETEIHALAGSEITATSFLVMGKSSSNAGFASEGRIVVLTSTPVTLKDLDGAFITDVAFTDTDPDVSLDPSIRCTGGLTVQGLVTGTGILDAFTSAQQNNPQILRCVGATLSPGDASAAGMISLNGNSLLSPTNRIEIDIFDATTHDQVRTLSNLVLNQGFHTVPSDITLGGTLVVRVAPGHIPTSGETHEIIGTNHGLLGPDGGVFGAFAAVEAPRHWHINVIPQEGTFQDNGVFAVYCPADFNEDGFLDFFDVDAFVSAFEGGEPDSDFNGDGFIDFFDADEFTLAFEAGC